MNLLNELEKNKSLNNNAKETIKKVDNAENNITKKKLPPKPPMIKK